MPDFFRVQFGIVSRSEGHCAAKRSAYQSCGVIVAHDGERFDFGRKAAEHVATLMLVPQGAPDWTRSPQSLWQCAAAAEMRVDAQEARIVDFSLPRAVPAELWESCVRYVYKPFVDMGMAMQIDIHDSPASDGGRNINVHGMGTLRELDGDGFAKRKNRAWNDAFRERSGRVIREQFAARLTEFCLSHGIDYRGDARPNSERDLPDPEPELPRWNFEYAGRTGKMPEALASLHDHRRRRREWEKVQAEEIEAALELRQLEMQIRAQRQRRIVPVVVDQKASSKRDRRAAILRAWHKGGWIDADTIPAIAAVRFDPTRDLLWIDLADGTTLIDRGDAITMKGAVTWTAALETASAAERHGWKSVQVNGDQAYKDAVTIACMLRGIEVLNHSLSPKAQAVFDRLLASQPNHSKNLNEPGRVTTGAAIDGLVQAPSIASSTPSSRDVHRALTKRISVANPPPTEPPDTEGSAPVFRPAFTRRRQPEKLHSDHRRTAGAD